MNAEASASRLQCVSYSNMNFFQIDLSGANSWQSWPASPIMSISLGDKKVSRWQTNTSLEQSALTLQFDSDIRNGLELSNEYNSNQTKSNPYKCVFWDININRWSGEVSVIRVL